MNVCLLVRMYRKCLPSNKMTRARYYTLPTTAITTVITHYCYISKKTINNKSIVSSYTIFEKWLSTPQLLGGIRYVPSRYGRRIVLAFMLAITPNVGRLMLNIPKLKCCSYSLPLWPGNHLTDCKLSIRRENIEYAPA
ncbi:hypothetical protein GQX74_006633 [Glossina fuscipes]|nr:hypothetical protein GQX74_006633 [Glossina fuscipes]